MTEEFTNEDGSPRMMECPECHGEQEFSCISGCHTRPCQLCDGEGEIWSGDEPV